VRCSRQAGCREANAIFGVLDFEQERAGTGVGGEKSVSDLEPPLTQPFTGKHYTRETTAGRADGEGTRFRFHSRKIERHTIFEIGVKE
jgi:hypothetical protein